MIAFCDISSRSFSDSIQYTYTTAITGLEKWIFECEHGYNFQKNNSPSSSEDDDDDAWVDDNDEKVRHFTEECPSCREKIVEDKKVEESPNKEV